MFLTLNIQKIWDSMKVPNLTRIEGKEFHFQDLEHIFNKIIEEHLLCLRKEMPKNILEAY